MMAESDNALLQRCGGGRGRHSVCRVCHASFKRSVAAAHFLCLSLGLEWVLGFYTETRGMKEELAALLEYEYFSTRLTHLLVHLP